MLWPFFFAVRLLRLQLTQFRNYGSLDLSLSPERDLELFVGENGSGKTNILEAVGLLSLTKSFLGADEEDLAQWGTEFYRVTGTVRSDVGEEQTLEIASQLQPRKQKACFLNDVRSPVSQMIGQMPIVTFLPQDLSLFSGPPAERRRFIDQILSQVSSQYFFAFLEYQKLLKQRNALLRSIREGRARTQDLDTWDSALADRATVITLLRLELMETFSLTLGSEVESLGEEWAEVSMHYMHAGTTRTRVELAAELRQALRDSLERDLVTESTGVGPHRDDWEFRVAGRPLKTFASRGQQRVAVLALLFLEASYLEIRRGEKPIIILDDIFSELDDAHRARVIDAFTAHQVLMTTTHVPPLAEKEKVEVWGVKRGAVASYKT